MRKRSKALSESGVVVIRHREDRGEQIRQDPDAYFDAARQRARELVERDLERERLADA